MREIDWKRVHYEAIGWYEELKKERRGL